MKSRFESTSPRRSKRRPNADGESADAQKGRFLARFPRSVALVPLARTRWFELESFAGAKSYRRDPQPCGCSNLRPPERVVRRIREGPRVPMDRHFRK